MSRPDYLPDYLTDEQAEAILHQGSPLLVIAGPGSGKTEVISWRVAHLVRAGYVRPENLLVTTFTEKAAQELKDRIQKNLPDINVELMQVSTIHAFCADLLRRHRRESPLPRGFRILDGAGQFLFVYANRKALGLGDLVKGRPHDFFSSVVRLFNLATEELVDPDRLEAWVHDELRKSKGDEAQLWEERAAVAEAYDRYCTLLREQELIDFAFLQRHALTMLEQHPDLCQVLRQHYQEILVDEYQDTNAAQAFLLRHLAGDGRRLSVVGDDDQSIYRFRGATVRNIREFGTDFLGAHTIKLVKNFRSRPPIVDHSLKVIRQNPARFDKALEAVRSQDTDVVLVYEHSVADEAQTVVSLLREWHASRQLPRYGDVAILLRSVRSYAGPYLEALQRAGIPYSVLGDASFFDREEIQDLYNLFSFLGTAKPWGDKYVRAPLVGLSETSCEVLARYKESLLDIASEAALRDLGIEATVDRRRLMALLTLKRKVQAQEQRSLLEVFYDLLAATGCVARFERAGNVEALANLGVMSHLVANWDEYGSSRNFYPFQDYLKLMKEGGVDPVTLPPEDCVQIMTIHQAKGLEFPVVVVGSVLEGRLPTSRREERYDIPYTMRASQAPEVDDPHLVDERKLFYVAITRARDVLVVGTADVVNKRGGGPSRFVTEMFGQDLATAARSTQATVESQAHGTGPRERTSFSQLAYFLQCPMRYKFASVYDFQIPWLDPVDFGANVHRALDAIHQRALDGQPPEVGDVPAIVEETWISPRRTEPDAETRFKAAAIHQLQRYLRQDGDQLHRVLQTEVSFSFGLEDQILIGKIDLLRRRGEGQVEVVDFKTGESDSAAKAYYRLQMDLYALGAQENLGVEVTAQQIHFLGDGEHDSFSWSREREAAVRQGLSTILQRIKRGDFAPNTAYCPSCDEFRAICPYGVKPD